MKVKSPAETANLGPNHKYLGHFRKAKNLNRGHNDSGGLSGLMEKLLVKWQEGARAPRPQDYNPKNPPVPKDT